jgi:pyridoxine/pyridoxamine 5'-phosphate oxidase
VTLDPHPWASDLSQLYAEVWTRLTRGIHDRHAPARHPTLATVTPQGRPQARTVVLRAANKTPGTLDIHTDLGSAKVEDLRVTPFAALHVWDSSAHLQLRLEAQVTILTGQDVASIWDGVPAASRLSYGITPPPSPLIDYEENYDGP